MNRADRIAFASLIVALVVLAFGDNLWSRFYDDARVENKLEQVEPPSGGRSRSTATTDHEIKKKQDHISESAKDVDSSVRHNNQTTAIDNSNPTIDRFDPRISTETQGIGSADFSKQSIDSRSNSVDISRPLFITGRWRLEYQTCEDAIQISITRGFVEIIESNNNLIYAQRIKKSLGLTVYLDDGSRFYREREILNYEGANERASYIRCS